jgi:hypothetical protein
MTSIIKVDTLQKANGATPTAADLGINTSGNVLQVDNGLFTGHMSIGTYNYTNVTNLSVTLTPKSTNSKFILKPSLSISCNYFSMGFRILRDSLIQSDYIASGVESRQATTAHVNPYKSGDTTGSNAYQAFYVSGEYVDNTSAPDTTTPITWLIQASCYNGGAINRGQSDNNNSAYFQSVSSFVVYEIQK